MTEETSTAEPAQTPKTGVRARLADPARWPRRWWWPDAPPPETEDDAVIVRLHDEASMTIRRVMMALIAYGFFCLFTLSQPDTVLVAGKFKLPFANIEIAFTDFLIVGPLILIGFAFYLHIFIGYWCRISTADTGKALPFIFNMDGRMPRFMAGFMFYWLVPLVLWVFTYKAGPHGVLAPLLLLTVATASVLWFLQIRRTPAKRRPAWDYRLTWLAFTAAAAFTLYLGGQQATDLTVASYRSAVGLVQPVLVATLSDPAPPSTSTSETARPPTVAKGGTPERPLGLTRALELAGADLRKVDLSARELSGAILSSANLANAKLSNRNLARADLRNADLNKANLVGANLQGANLAGADLSGANLKQAKLQNAVALTCSELRQARNWELAFRDRKLSCGAPIPPYFRDCPGCPEMIRVSAGRFMMGSPATEEGREGNESPHHRVTISRDFAVGKFEVTRAEYAKFAKATGHAEGDECRIWAGGKWTKERGKGWRDPGYRQTDRDPVACVNWEDARAYSVWLSGKTGKRYRLLTEAEWEYVARAGTTGRYWWGKTIGTNKANCKRCGSQWDGERTAPVGRFNANPFGLHDTAGNVLEWVQDCSHGSFKGAPTNGSAWIKGGDCKRRIFRGGSWDLDPSHLRSADRGWQRSERRFGSLGFRVARTLP